MRVRSAEVRLDEASGAVLTEVRLDEASARKEALCECVLQDVRLDEASGASGAVLTKTRAAPGAATAPNLNVMIL